MKGVNNMLNEALYEMYVNNGILKEFSIIDIKPKTILQNLTNAGIKAYPNTKYATSHTDLTFEIIILSRSLSTISENVA